MAVSKPILKAAIKAAFDNEKNKIDNQQESIDRIAEAIANAVSAQIVQGIDTAAVTHVLTTSMGPVSGTITIKASAE